MWPPDAKRWLNCGAAALPSALLGLPLEQLRARLAPRTGKESLAVAPLDINEARPEDEVTPAPLRVKAATETIRNGRPTSHGVTLVTKGGRSKQRKR